MEELDKKFIQYLTKQVNNKYLTNKGFCYRRDFRNYYSTSQEKKCEKKLSRYINSIFKYFK